MPERVRYFAFIRAINTGRRRLTNDRVVAPFHEMGFSDVAAYQAAGNVAFSSDDPALAVPQRIEPRLAAAYGFDAPTFVRTADEIHGIADGGPFSPVEVAATDGRVQVVLMHSPPDPAAIRKVMALVPSEDRLEFRGREWFWLPVAGVADSLLPVAEIETMVGPMTMRTLGTITRMRDRFVDG